MQTTVVNKNKDEYDIYIGRGSKWGNPFKIGTDGTRSEVLNKYKKYIKENPHILEGIEKLHGKRLGCFCAPKGGVTSQDYLICHGQILAEIADEKKARCVKCPLHHTAKTQVIGRGHIPAKILFVGEGPGKTEDVKGLPFCGPAGIILYAGIAMACKMTGVGNPPPYYITNLVRCRPVDLEGKNRPPTEKEFWACREYLEQIYIDANPSEVILLGKTALKYAGPMFPGATVLDHPAYIGRQGGTESAAFIKFSRKLSEAIKRAKQKPERMDVCKKNKLD